MSVLLCSCDGITEYRACIYKKEIDISKKDIKYSAKKIDGTEVYFETEKEFDVGDVVKIRPVFSVKKITKE